jgi:hypothetical protein
MGDLVRLKKSPGLTNRRPEHTVAVHDESGIATKLRQPKEQVPLARCHARGGARKKTHHKWHQKWEIRGNRRKPLGPRQYQPDRYRDDESAGLAEFFQKNT